MLRRRDRVDVLLGHNVEGHFFWEDNVEGCKLFDLDKSYDFNNAPVVQALRQAKAENSATSLVEAPGLPGTWFAF